MVRGSQGAACAPEPFVLFDPADAPARLYRGHAEHRAAHRDAEVPAVMRWIEAELERGRELVLFLGFEAAAPLAGLPVAHRGAAPLVEALSFGAPELLDEQQRLAWLAEAQDGHDAAAPAGLAGWRRGLSRGAYEAALRRIGDYLAAGDSYQIDYTFGMRARAFGHPCALYGALRARQPTPYRCLARLPGRWVLSFSPELFFTLEQPGRIATRPMKGTAARSLDAQRDRDAAAALRADPKNRAENLMILDLLRNDLGRIARPGSVQVPERFAVEAHRHVWQMTSAVQAELAPGLGWDALWRALFPCGSVVGAPKHRSMAIIGELEPTARGLYTGAIGWLAPVQGAAPEQVRGVFSVGIRTLELDAEARRGTRAARLGLGSGVVADSVPADEWRECLLKGRFATELDPGFGLIETFSARWPENAALIQAHWRRLRRSARFFGFRCDWRELAQRLQAAHAVLPQDGAYRTRVELRHDGEVRLEVLPLTPLQPASDGEVGLLLAADLGERALDRHDVLLRHKTTHRAHFDRAWRAAQARGAFDALFFNRDGELCEGGRSSVFVRLEGRWYTPPLRCGLLPGITRAALLADSALQARERVLGHAELLRAEALLVCNALRGALPARLQRAP